MTAEELSTAPSAPPEVAGLVLAGPRAGKTNCVVIPALLSHPGPALGTSTKPEVLYATLAARRTLGRVWFFNLTGSAAPPGTVPLRWSPLTRASDWQGAQLVAEAMHLLQSSPVLVNTLIIQQILAEPEWAGRLTESAHASGPTSTNPARSIAT
jgi:Type IV secretory system Conjugative DNA transfer